MDNKMTKKENDKLTLENRVLILEIFKDRIEKEFDKFELKLDTIVKGVIAIKWSAITAAGLFVMDKIGMVEFVKGILL